MIRIGLSGWSYREWRGGFYPPDLPPKDGLRFVGQRFSTVEINGTFYGTQTPERFERWYAAVPEDFVFALKGPRYATHTKRLQEPEPILARFFASGPLRLREKLGPVLWQLPAGLPFDEALLDRFCTALPRDTAAAAELAGLDPGLAGGEVRPLRHALEVRHPTFATSRFIDLLRRQGVTLAFADGPGWPAIHELTTDLVYVRMHGSVVRYVSGYSADELDDWAQRIRSWAGVSSAVFVYFNNTAASHAPYDALALAERLGR